MKWFSMLVDVSIIIVDIILIIAILKGEKK